jgi:hypothetical protein
MVAYGAFLTGAAELAGKALPKVRKSVSLLWPANYARFGRFHIMMHDFTRHDEYARNQHTKAIVVFETVKNYRIIPSIYYNYLSPSNRKFMELSILRIIGKLVNNDYCKDNYKSEFNKAIEGALQEQLNTMGFNIKVIDVEINEIRDDTSNSKSSIESV